MSDNPNFTYVWSIENFSLYYPWFSGTIVCSLPFWVFKNESYFCLRVSPGGRLNSPGIVGLSLQFSSFKATRTVDCEFSYLSTDDSPLVTERKLRTTENCFTWKMENCPTQEELFVTKRSVFLPEDVLKVRCRMWIPGETVSEPTVACEIGRVLLQKSATIFSKTNLSMFCLDEKQRLQSNNLFFSEVGKLVLKLELSGDEQVLEDADIDIEVTLWDFETYNFCQLSLLNQFGQSVISQLKSGSLSNGKSVYKFGKFIKRKKLLDEEKFSPGHVLSLLCELIQPQYVPLQRYKYDPLIKNIHNFLSNASETKRPLNEISFPEPPPVTSLQEDLLSLYKEHKFSDFKLRTEATSFPAHKAILAARSPVFEALFSSDMKEIASGFQDIPDVDKETVDQMLLFVYTDIVRDLQWEGAAKLYYAADKYQILSLRQKCSAYLQNQLSMSNVYEALEIADRHNDSGLRSAVEEFLVDHADETINSEEWRMFSDRNLQLANQTMCKMISKLTLYRKKSLPS